MKTKILFLLLFPFAALAQKANFRITGKIAQPPGNKWAYLNYASNGKAHSDSAKIINGVFELKGDVKDPVTGFLSIHAPLLPGQHVSGMIPIYLEAGNISVNSPDSLAHASITGTPMNDDYQKLRSLLQATDDKAILISKQRALLSSDDRKRTEKDYYAAIRPLSAARDKAMKEFIGSNSSSLVSLDVMGTMLGPIPDFSKTDSIFQTLSPSVKNSSKGKVVAAMLEKLRKVELGSIAPEFTQADTAGKLISLSSLRGKYVLIDFWASWCVPCRAENPVILKAYNEYKSKNFTILGVSLDLPNAKKAWVDAIKKDGLTWINVSDLKSFNNEAAQLYSVRAIPQNFLLDPQGKIIAKNLRGEELQKELTRWLSK